MNSLYDRGTVCPRAVPDLPNMLGRSAAFEFVWILSRGLFSAISEISCLKVVTVKEVRVNERLSFHLLLVEALICSAEVSCFKIFL